MRKYQLVNLYTTAGYIIVMNFETRLKSTWIPFVRTSNGDMSWQPPKCAEMCALHFEDNMFRDTGRQRLEEWAFPTSSSPSPSPSKFVITWSNWLINWDV